MFPSSSGEGLGVGIDNARWFFSFHWIPAFAGMTLVACIPAEAGGVLTVLLRKQEES